MTGKKWFGIFISTNLAKTMFSILLLIYVISLAVTPGFAQQHSNESSLGQVNFSISCSAAGQSKFNRGLALLHHMMYAQAEKEFTALSELEPDCPMAYWGIAMTLFHPLWSEPSEEELRRGWAAVEKAQALKPNTEREQSYIDAVEAFYRDWKTIDHSKRIAAWEAAQEKIYQAKPDDIDAGAFYALAHLATAPKGDKTFKHQQEAGALLEGLQTKAPEHPGLFHYLIHAYDNPMLASRAVEVARGYDKLAPDVPHALHMASHIFIRLGLWADSIDWNMRSAAAAKRHSSGGMMSLHYTHAMDYLMYAYLQRSQDKMAETVLQQINTVGNYQDSFASAYGIAAAQARYYLERRQWTDAAALPIRTHSTFPWDKYPWFESITYFARGLGAIRSGDTAAAQKAIETLDTFYEHSVNAGQDYWSVQVDVQRKTLAAWIAFAAGEKEQALRIMRQAAVLEDSVDKHPVTPGAVLPARELLGDILVLLDKPNEAIDAYEASLEISPNRFNSLYGAGYAAELTGDQPKAKSYYSKLVQLTTGVDSDRPRIRQAKAFLSQN
jgi:tetratricopeptide (TPR) repeat protein